MTKHTLHGYSPDPALWGVNDVVHAIKKEIRNRPPGRDENDVWAIVAPRLLLDLSKFGLRDGVLTKLVGPIWSRSNYPFVALTKDGWRDLFHRARYTEGHTGKPFWRAGRPRKTQTLYRASLPEFADNFSWSTNLDLVRYWFVQQYSKEPGARIYTADVAPERYLCRVLDPEECVVETDGLEIREFEDGATARSLHRRTANPIGAAHAYRELTPREGGA